MSDLNDVVTQFDIPGLKKVSSGKVREIFEVDESTLLFVATDRISAYDVVMENGIPSKGALLTQLSAFWFSHLATHLPSLQTHLVPTSSLDASTQALLSPRSMLVRRHPLVKLESIVRGYITGSAWAEYRKHGTVHGRPMPAGLRESERLPEPIWTPSTKAELGEHDENISREKAAEIVGAEVAKKVEAASLQIYELARAHAASVGIIIADTKFEFGLNPSTGDIVLVDEVLTPDSSRFWPADAYTIGQAQESYDKQYLRDWLTREGLKGKYGVRMPGEVVRQTREKYVQAYERLTGKSWTE